MSSAPHSRGKSGKLTQTGPLSVTKYSSLLHSTIHDTDVAPWLGPFNIAIATRPLLHQTPSGATDEFVSRYQDECTDVMVTLDTLADIGISSGTTIELGTTSDLRGRSSHVDSVTAGTLFAATLNNPMDNPMLCEFDDPTPTLTPVSTSCTATAQDYRPEIPQSKPPVFDNLLANGTIYISPQTATQIGYTPTTYAHLPLDSLLCNTPHMSCSHSAQFAKTQTEFAQHKPSQPYTADNLLTLDIPLPRQLFIRVLPQPTTTEVVPNKQDPADESTSLTQDTSNITQDPHKPPVLFTMDELYGSTPDKISSSFHSQSSLNIHSSGEILRQATHATFLLLPPDNAFDLDITKDILRRYLSRPDQSAINRSIVGRRLHVGMVIAVPLLLSESQRLTRNGIERNLYDLQREHEAQEQAKQASGGGGGMAAMFGGGGGDEPPGPDHTIIPDVFYFLVASLSYNDNTYLCIDNARQPMIKSDGCNTGDNNNFLSCLLERPVASTFNDARTTVGLSDLQIIEYDTTTKQGKKVSKKDTKKLTPRRYYTAHEQIQVDRTSSLMHVTAYTELNIYAYNVTTYYPTLYTSLMSYYVSSSHYNFHRQYYTMLSHAIAIQQEQLQHTDTTALDTSSSSSLNSLISLIHKYPSIIFPIPQLDLVLLRGFGPYLTQLIEALLPSLYTCTTHVLPLIQSPYRNAKSALLRSVSLLFHMSYSEIDVDEIDGIIHQHDWLHILDQHSSICNIRNIGLKTVIPQLRPRIENRVNNIYCLTTRLSDLPNNVLPSDVIVLPMPSSLGRARAYIYELLLQSHTYNILSCDVLSSMLQCIFILLTGYTNAPTHSISLLVHQVLTRIIHTYQTSAYTIDSSIVHQATKLALGYTQSSSSSSSSAVPYLPLSQHDVLRSHCTVLSSLLQLSHTLSGIPSTSWKDIGAAGGIRKELMALIKPKSQNNNAAAFSMQRRGVLLYGPPGSGKTLVAKALAGESGISFCTANAGEILSMYIGESEKKIRDLFIQARNSAPCVLFLDEIDSLAPSKNNEGNSSGGVMQRVVSQLLLEIDALNDDGLDVFLVGATNRPELLDLSLLRPGRLDRSIYVGISETIDDQLQILKALTRKFTLGPHVNLRNIIKKYCYGRPMTGADFFALASTAMTHAIMESVGRMEAANRGDDTTLIDDIIVEDLDEEQLIKDKSQSGTKLQKAAAGSVGDIAFDKLNGPNGLNAMLGDTSSSSSTTVNHTPKDGLDLLSALGNANSNTKAKVSKAATTIDDMLNGSKPQPAPAPATSADAATTTTTTTTTTTDGTATTAPRRKKKKNAMYDGILAIEGLAFDTPAPEPEKVQPIEATTTPVDDAATGISTTTTTTTEPAVPTVRKKKKKLLDSILGFDGMVFDTPAPVSEPVSEPEPQPESQPEPVVESTTPSSAVTGNDDVAAVTGNDDVAEPPSIDSESHIENTTDTTEATIDDAEPVDIDEHDDAIIFDGEGEMDFAEGEFMNELGEGEMLYDPEYDDADADHMVMEHGDEDDEQEERPGSDYYDEDYDEDYDDQDDDESDHDGNDADNEDADDDNTQQDNDIDEEYDVDKYGQVSRTFMPSLTRSILLSKSNNTIKHNNNNNTTYDNGYDSDDSDCLFEPDYDDDYYDDILPHQAHASSQQNISSSTMSNEALSIAETGVIVYARHFVQAAKSLTPSLSQQELDHYAKIRQSFSSKRQKAK